MNTKRIIEMPENVMNSIMILSTSRKVRKQQNATQKSLIVELLELGLQLLEQQERATEQEAKA